MKKRGFPVFFVLFIIFATCFKLNGQPIAGDYRSHQSGSWNVAANWEKFDGSVWVYPATEYPPLASPYISSRVTIQSGHTITATGNAGGTTGGVLEILQGGVLEMGAYPIRGTSQSSKFPEIIIGGTLNTASYVSSITFTVEATGKFTTSYIGLRGWWYSGYSPTTLALSGEIEFSGLVEQKIPDYKYNNLTISGSGDKVPAETEVIVEGTLNIVSGGRLVLAGAILYCNGTGIVLNGTLDGAASSIEFNGVSQNLSGTGTFGSLTDSFLIGTTEATNLTISNSNSITLNAIIIIPGSTLNISPVSKVTVLGTLDTGDGLFLKASSSSPYTCASLIIDPAAEVFGDINSEIYLTGGGDEGTYKWHYISSPFTSLGIGPFTAVTQDLAQFVESRPSSYLMQGWVAYDGYIYVTGTKTGPTFNTLDPGKGYNFWDGANNNLVISGSPNKTDITLPLAYNGTSLSGHNLLGNPFSSGLNWDLIANGSYYPFPANTSKAVYFTRDNEQCSYVNGIGSPSDVTGIIPPMQGFFVLTKASGNSIILPAEARTHNSTHQRYKGAPEEIPLVRLALFENEVQKDETVIRFDEMAKPEFDLEFDASKMFLSETRTTIHTAINGTNFSINGLPFPAKGVVTQIPVVINLPSDGTHKISASQIQALETYDIALKDNLTSTTMDLRSTPEYIFVSNKGLMADRFTLLVGDNLMTGIEDPVSPTRAFSIYNGFGFINILPLSDTWNESEGSIRLYNMMGKIISDIPYAEFRKNTLIQIESPSSKGVYIIEIKSGIRRFTGKIVIN